MPPNPNKKAHKIILIEIAFIGTEATKFTPLVSSIMPERRGFISSTGIPSKFVKGAIIWLAISNKWLWLQIDRITEKITTKPPMSKTVEVALWILLPKTSPKEEKT